MKKYLLFIFVIFLFVSCFEEDTTTDEKECNLECEKTEFCAFYIGEPTCVDIELNTSWTNLTSNWNYSCAINNIFNDDDEAASLLYCWGDPKASDFRNDVISLPTIENELPWEVVSRDYEYSCGISSGKLYCWGGNYNYQYGLREQEDIYYDQPQQIGIDEDWKTISTGSYIFATKSDNSLYCWGMNQPRDMGFGNNTGVPILIEHNIKDSSFGAGSACFINNNGELYCWGDNHYGVLGTGDKSLREAPVLIGTDWKKVVTAYNKTCGIKTDGSLYCWGKGNSSFIFGDDKEDKLVPTKVGDATNWEKIFLSDNYGCAINSDTELYCWGENSVGELGLGDRKIRTSPTKVGENWKEVAGGFSHICGIKTDGSLYCWGTNAYGELGLGIINPVGEPNDVRDTPQRIIIKK